MRKQKEDYTKMGYSPKPTSPAQKSKLSKASEKESIDDFYE